MSERMIELQRARLLAAGKANTSSSSSQPTQNGSQANRPLSGVAAAAPQQVRQTPRQIAAHSVQSEDLKMQRFFQRLQDRDDSRAASSSGPTVPTALSRRILHRQGAGYVDDTVGAICSAAADRFLGIVLQQAVACRDQRLKGTEMARESARYRKRHMQHYQAESDDRKRRKDDAVKRREKTNLAAIEAGAALKKSGAAASAGDASVDASKSKKKKQPDSATPVNGNIVGKRNEDQGDPMYDSIDEEEEHYQEHYGDESLDVNDEEEDDDMLLLCDIARPLEAWDFRVTGKVGMEPANPNDDVDDNDFLADDEENDLSEQVQTAEAESTEQDGKNGSEQKSPTDSASKTSRPKSTSPTPNASKPAST
jgi:hypothetical protein